MATVTPWWDQTTGIYIGAIGGAAIGLIGATLGTCAGVFASRGKGKAIILPSFLLVVLFCLAAVIAGIVAICVSQPYHVWYGPLLVGSIGTIVLGSLFPVIRMRYQQAEQRRIDAESLKRS